MPTLKNESRRLTAALGCMMIVLALAACGPRRTVEEKIRICAIQKTVDLKHCEETTDDWAKGLSFKEIAEKQSKCRAKAERDYTDCLEDIR